MERNGGKGKVKSYNWTLTGFLLLLGDFVLQPSNGPNELREVNKGNI